MCKKYFTSWRKSRAACGTQKTWCTAAKQNTVPTNQVTIQHHHCIDRRRADEGAVHKTFGELPPNKAQFQSIHPCIEEELMAMIL
jgi:hypothetical protein